MASTNEKIVVKYIGALFKLNAVTIHRMHVREVHVAKVLAWASATAWNRQVLRSQKWRTRLTR